jgi:signal transduction histidine kinase
MLSRRRSTSIRTKLVAGFAGLIICVVLFVAGYYPSRLTGEFLERLEAEAQSAAKLLAYHLAPAVEFDDPEAAESGIRGVRRLKDVRYMGVFSKEGRLLASYGKRSDSGKLRDQKKATIRKAGDRLILQQPIMGIQGYLVGYLVLESSLARLNAKRWEDIRNTGYVGAVILLMGLAVAYTIQRLVARPIAMVTRGVERIAQGELAAPDVQVASNDEIGKLARAFNKMRNELQQTQAKLVQSGKLAAVGELAAGVAHEINNPLSAVLTYSVLLRQQVESLPSDVQVKLDDFPRKLSLIKEGADRCKAISDNLLAFSRQSSAEMRQVQLQAILQKTLNMIGSQLKAQMIKVKLDMPADLVVLGNESELQQVFTNIAMNGAQSMTDGGMLSIRASRDDNQQVEIAVSDCGKGIPAEDLEKIFDPFFTTKPKGGGTGLGLSIVHGIVNKHRGHIWVESVMEEGTTVHIRLPTGDRQEGGA